MEVRMTKIEKCLKILDLMVKGGHTDVSGWDEESIKKFFSQEDIDYFLVNYEEVYLG
jgi:hypothetical protein